MGGGEMGDCREEKREGANEGERKAGVIKRGE